MCPKCKSSSSVKFGSYSCRGERVQRYRCRTCRRTFNLAQWPIQFRDQKPSVNQPLLLLLCSGVSQRRVALGVKLTRTSVANKIRKYGRHLREWHENWLKMQHFGTSLVFDEMESFEHSKCKPLSIAIAVEHRRRFIIGAHVASMPAKGRLAQISRKRYGFRRDDRRISIQKLMDDMVRANADAKVIKSDMAPRYPRFVKRNFPSAKHKTYKGRRGCVVGQGELKAGGFDPLFSLNHTCAMFRDNLKRLSRRTWCTTKKPEQLQNLVNIYTVFHNRRLMNLRTDLLAEGSIPQISASTIREAS